MQTSLTKPAFQPPNILAAMPPQLTDYRLRQAKNLQSPFSEGRPYLFRLLAQNDTLDRQTIWKYLFPYRSISTCINSPEESNKQVYESILSSLVKWFSVDPLTPVNFILWSIAMMVSMMRSIGTDFEAKGIFVHLATQDIKDLFEKATPSQLQLLARRLMVSDGKCSEAVIIKKQDAVI